MLWLYWLLHVLAHFAVYLLTRYFCAFNAIHVLAKCIPLPCAIWRESFQFVRVASDCIGIVTICDSRSFYFGLIDQISFITIKFTPFGRVVLEFLSFLNIIIPFILASINQLFFVRIFGWVRFINQSLWFLILCLIVKRNWFSQHWYSLRELRWILSEWIIFYIIYRFILFITTLFSINIIS